ncbi:3-dehydroquinate synthase [Lachnospiraceae bacterium 62-35]
MSERITVHVNERPVYDIIIEPSFEKLSKEVFPFIDGRRLCIVTDSNVAALYLDEVQEILRPCCREVISFVFPAGEEQKNLDTVRRLYETLILAHFDRNDVLLALGGGVAGDLCGYGAATYLRGISFIQVPTTLLSQVDSSIGGKTGVDFDAYKNMVGAFHMPLLVYSNTAALKTLPPEQFSSGMGEVIKHGLIQDKDYYQFLERERAAIINRNPDVCERMIAGSDIIKRRVVEEDPSEKGIRALLNFGHTLGHAIEKLGNFQMLHGHCVGLGSLAAAYISADRGLISLEEAEHVKFLLESFSIPVSLKDMEAASIIAATKNDKKMDSGVIKFILLEKIGSAYVDRSVTEDEMRKGLARILDPSPNGTSKQV